MSQVTSPEPLNVQSAYFILPKLFELALAKKKVLSTLLGQMLSGNNRRHTNAIQVTQSCFKNTGEANYSNAESNFFCHCNPQEQVKIKCYSNHSHINLLYQSHNLKPREEFGKINQFTFKMCSNKGRFIVVWSRSWIQLGGSLSQHNVLKCQLYQLRYYISRVAHN